jgi:hypothetical protein
MLLGQLGTAGYGEQVSRLRKRTESKSSDIKTGGKKITRADSYTPTGGSIKAKNLDEVKSRVKNNFYNSDIVNSDLTEVISKLFNQA